MIIIIPFYDINTALICLSDLHTCNYDNEYKHEASVLHAPPRVPCDQFVQH